VPQEADILTPPQPVATRVDRWNAVLDESVPTKLAGSNLLVATWNLRAFGDLTKAWTTAEGLSPKRNFADVHVIAAVIRRFDGVADERFDVVADENITAWEVVRR
jgi:hypothetical protein